MLLAESTTLTRNRDQSDTEGTITANVLTSPTTAHPVLQIDTGNRHVDVPVCRVSLSHDEPSELFQSEDLQAFGRRLRLFSTGPVSRRLTRTALRGPSAPKAACRPLLHSDTAFERR